MDSSKAAYVIHKGEVKWTLQEIEVPTVEQCVREDALEVQDIRELGLGWAWFVNYLRTFLPAWQDMELASPSPEEPVTQIEADVRRACPSGPGKNSPAREQAVRRITRDLHTQCLLEVLNCESLSQAPLHRKCLPECSPSTSHTRDIETTFVYRLLPRLTGSMPSLLDFPPSHLPSRGRGGVPPPFQKLILQFAALSGCRL